MLKESGDNKVAHITFFGGETLLNFPVLKKTIAYARQRGAEVGKEVDFSLTTNGTLLKPEIIEFLAENQVGVTISIDGPREVQDKFRVFHNGTGSYDVVAPKIKELLQAAPQPADRRARHADLGDARHQADLPSSHRGDRVLGGRLRAGDDVAGPRSCHFRAGLRRHARPVPAIWRTSSSSTRSQNRHHGFSNVKETLEEIHKGMSKAYPVRRRARPDGRRHRRRRRAVPPLRRLRRAQAGDRRATASTGTRSMRSSTSTTSRTRPTAARAGPGRSARAAAITRRTRATARRRAPNLHYCDWIRGWTDVCLQIYGELSERNPAFLAQFDDKMAAEPVS